MTRPKLLYLVHRIPYPPNKGDKIRSYNLLRYLAERYEVYLGAFVDDPEDLTHGDRLEEYCAQIKLVPLDPNTARVKSLRGLLDGRPLTLPYYSSGEMSRWVERVISDHGIRQMLVFSSAMAQFVMGERFEDCRRVIDFVDVDSDKWRQYAQTSGILTRWLYRREAKRLLCYERRVAAAFDASVFVSDSEARLFRELSPRTGHKVFSAGNGVDLTYFDPAQPLENPFRDAACRLVFTGAMDYWPNIDAVVWFAKKVLPEVRACHPDCRFVIVGAHPAENVQALSALPGVDVLGRVPDVRPYVRHATLAVAPMRLARGIQNKVLESMALARATVVTPAGFEGIEASIGDELLVADGHEEFTRAVLDLLDNPARAEQMGQAARQRMLASYDWKRQLARFDRLFAGDEDAGVNDRETKVG